MPTDLTTNGNREPDGPGRTRDGSVLVVDSDAQGLVFLSMMLQKLGYRACTALGVGRALELVSDSLPAVIISELNLRGLNGLDLLQRLREEPRAREVPVVIMTAEFTPELDRRCREAGASACLEKPVLADELYQAVQPAVNPGSRRRDFRIRTSLSVHVNDRPLDCVEGECATNLSANGIFLRTLNPYPVDARVRIEVTLYGQAVEAEARVVYCRPPGEENTGMWGIGLQFLKTSPQGGEIIRRFINDEVSHGIAPGLE
jgi:two-component system, chemotaxis family, chemotaxis protein CheY